MQCQSLLLRRSLELAANRLSKVVRLSPAAVARGEVEPPRLGQVLSRRPSKKMFLFRLQHLTAVDLVPFLVVGGPNVGGWSSAEVAIFLKKCLYILRASALYMHYVLLFLVVHIQIISQSGAKKNKISFIARQQWPFGEDT